MSWDAPWPDPWASPKPQVPRPGRRVGLSRWGVALVVVLVVVLIGVVGVVGLLWKSGMAMVENKGGSPLGWSGPDPELIVTGFEDWTVDQTREYWVEQVSDISAQLQERFNLEVFEEPRGDGGGGNCGPEGGFHEDGTFVGSVAANGALMSPVPEEDWDEAVQMVTQWADTHGFTHSFVVVDKPGVHNIEISNPVSNGRIDLVQIKNGAIYNIAVYVDSPCTRMSGEGLARTIQEANEMRHQQQTQSQD